jgi:hypothetical protein
MWGRGMSKIPARAAGVGIGVSFNRGLDYFS